MMPKGGREAIPLPLEIKNRLFLLLKKHSHEELSALCGLGRSTLSRILSYDEPKASKRVIQRIEALLNSAPPVTKISRFANFSTEELVAELVARGYQITLISR